MDYDQNIDIQNKRLKNVASPIEGKDAINYNFFQKKNGEIKQNLIAYIHRENLTLEQNLLTHIKKENLLVEGRIEKNTNLQIARDKETIRAPYTEKFVELQEQILNLENIIFKYIATPKSQLKKETLVIEGEKIPIRH